MSRLDSEAFGEMLDTSPAARARYYDLLSRMTLAQKAAALEGACRSMRKLAEAGLRLAHPEATDAELKVRLAVRLYGRTAARRMFGAVPADAR